MEVEDVGLVDFFHHHFGSFQQDGAPRRASISPLRRWHSTGLRDIYMYTKVMRFSIDRAGKPGQRNENEGSGSTSVRRAVSSTPFASHLSGKTTQIGTAPKS